MNASVQHGVERSVRTFEVVDHFEFDREVVSIALSYLDRVVSMKTKHSGEPMHRRDFQLVAVTCLYLAIKLHGKWTRMMDQDANSRSMHLLSSPWSLHSGDLGCEGARNPRVVRMESQPRLPAVSLLRYSVSLTVISTTLLTTLTQLALSTRARYLTELGVCHYALV
ncbi:Cyclin [Fragilaria crotonensis]|nr:Cyclin [Fragilaria crotonensis]